MTVAADPDLVRACLLAPLDAAPRLILADWLEERGWGDRLLLAALRGKGRWFVSGRREAVWDCDDAAGLFAEVYGTAVSLVSGGYDGDEPSSLQLAFGKAPDGVRCHACRRATSLEAAKAAGGGRLACWEHREVRRRLTFPRTPTRPEYQFALAGGWAEPPQIGSLVRIAGDYVVGPADEPDADGAVTRVVDGQTVQVRMFGPPEYRSVELWQGLDAAERYGVAVPEGDLRRVLGLPEPKGE